MKPEQPSTRSRLIAAATRLFADHGFRGASVRDICNLAAANPGAVSYHFGGKRQLYRTVLRQAAEALSEMMPGEAADEGEPQLFADRVLGAMGMTLRRVGRNPKAAQLVLRDLADGGEVAVEALAPVVRAAHGALAAATGHDDASRGGLSTRVLFLRLAAPIFLLTAAWPVLERALELAPADRETLLVEMLKRSLRSEGLAGS